MQVCDLKAQREELGAALDQAIRAVLDRGWYVLGEEVAGFEKEFAGYLGMRHAVGVGSGTEALHLALAAEGIGPGDDVLTTPMTAVPTVCAIALTGARPIFADVDPETALLDPVEVERRITPQTRAIIPVHLYGQCVPMDPFLELARNRGICIIEDAAQAHGATWKDRMAGTFGDYGCFSFYPTKNLGAYGDAGAVVTADDGRAERLRRLRNYGQTDRYRHVERGWNSRLDEIQAAILRVKLPHLTRWNEARRDLASRYQQNLEGSVLRPMAENPQGRSARHLFVVRVPDRDRLREALRARGIESQIHYPIPVHLQEAFSHLGYAAGDFPVAEKLAGSILSLPLYPELDPGKIIEICEAIHTILQED
ncbi:MAG: DegT/DnrJ/EryC1/StrS family aminotransferase [Candidatus Eisenbacteria bacterium]|uniref:DegT/DnrJ/EryC1/StrS family aminotransferase n=1 Tax=Eiseniibacteriota bacterium TaxID=2212470 RepID=A0A948W2A0_UNCEI|nr:DegT/DnrJ/EryC1/StrS family aminotransferase [Candidatus Eisenbacteria bacterium]MBU1949492.1 DegT/DnrJ/EryC1/StrS family aminotransferase [Candidatus Eisenbacteria bacterium]MBU2689722.1 DegT/DnrJ/EryC1/StrS family aminotransferase [Candidatus Eisenbacteria bacterium]